MSTSRRTSSYVIIYVRLLLNVELRNYVISRQIVERRVTWLRNITSDCYLNIVVSLDCYTLYSRQGHYWPKARFGWHWNKIGWSKTFEYSPSSFLADVDKLTDKDAGLSEPIRKDVTWMESKVMCMMLKVNIAFQRLYLGDVVNKTCIIARPLPASLHWFGPFGNISAHLTVQIQEVQLY